MRVNIKKDIISVIIASSVLGLILVVMMNGNNINLRSPLEYSGDVVGVFSEIKNLTFGNTLYYNPNLAAPFGSNQTLTMKGYLFHYVFMHILAFFTKDAALILNAFYFLTFFVIMWAAYFALRLVGIHPYISAVLSIVYSCLPYHFFRYEQHIYLGAYYVVPMICVSVYWIWTGELQSESYRSIKHLSLKNVFISAANKKMLVSLLSFFLLGITDFYYTAFLMILVVFSSVCVCIERKQYRYLVYGIILMLVLLFGVLVCLAPLILNYIKFGSLDTHFNDRTPGELVYYSLNVTQLLLPIQNHRIGILESLRQTYDDSFLVTENSMSSLGLISSFGFVICLISVFCRNFCIEIRKKMECLGKLNLFLILLSVSGGFSFFVAVFFTASIRCYNRTVVYIAFFSVMALGFFMMNYGAKLKSGLEGKKMGIILFGLLLICVIDQIPKDVAEGSYFDPEAGEYKTTISEVENEYLSDRNFVREIENQYSENVMIFQYPIVTNYYSNAWPSGKTGAYNSMRPYLHSTGKTSWSYGSIVGDKTDLWLRMLEKESIEEQIEVMALYGFKGIYIDSSGYEMEDLEILISKIEDITKSEYIISNNRKLYFFNISEYVEMFDVNKVKNKKNKYMIYYEFGEGFYPTEYSSVNNDSWNWGINNSQIIINNLFDQNVIAPISFEINSITAEKGNVKVELNGEQNVLEVSSNKRKYTVNMVLKPGNNVINVTTDLPNIKVANDPRELCISITNFQLKYESLEFEGQN